MQEIDYRELLNIKGFETMYPTCPTTLNNIYHQSSISSVEVYINLHPLVYCIDPRYTDKRNLTKRERYKKKLSFQISHEQQSYGAVQIVIVHSQEKTRCEVWSEYPSTGLSCLVVDKGEPGVPLFQWQANHKIPDKAMRRQLLPNKTHRPWNQKK